MAVQAQFGGIVLPPYAAEDQQMPALKDNGALLFSAAAATPGGADGYAWQQYGYCAAQSELTCNENDGGALTSRKRGRDDDEPLHYGYPPFLPLSGMRPPVDSSATAAASTTGRWAEAQAPAAEHGALASELLWQLHGAAEVDALVRAECDRLRAGLEQARKRQRQALLVQATLSALARRLREAEAQLEAARRRSLVLEERVRVAAAEAQAWRGVARGNEAVAAGLQATLDALLLRSTAAEGCGESEPGDAQSCCGYVQEAPETAAAATASSSSTGNGKWECRACGEGEASVLVLPCRHLCLCKACERRTDACPVCLGAKNASIHIAATTDGWPPCTCVAWHVIWIAP